MPKKFWQHPDSLEASRDPLVQQALKEGRHQRFNPNRVWGGRRALTFLEAAELGLVYDYETDHGLSAESDFEFSNRLLAAMFVVGGEETILTPREAEAVGYYLYGKRFHMAAEAWAIKDIDGMLWGLLAEHPPWSEIGSLMKRTAKGNPIGRGQAQRYLQRAAEKLNTTIPGLLDKAITGLYETRHRFKQDGAQRAAAASFALRKKLRNEPEQASDQRSASA
jgi:hypothetical protein